MPVFATAFDTTALSGHQAIAGKIRHTLQDALHRGQLVPEPQLDGCFMVDNNYSPEANPVPAFAHPVDFEGYDKDQRMVAVDMRGFTTFDKDQGERHIRLESEYDLAKARMLLNRVWLTESPEVLARASSVPMSLFSEWIAQNVGRKYILNFKEQLYMAIWAAFYYYGLHKTELEPSDMERVRIVDVIKKALNVDAGDVLKVIDGQTYPVNIIDFCERSREIVGNVRLESLNWATLYSLVKGTWFGPNNNETVAVALEHPPTWMAIVVSAFSERTYQKSSIARLTEVSRFREPGKQYVLALKRMLNYK